MTDPTNARQLPDNALGFLEACHKNAGLAAEAKRIAFSEERSLRATCLARLAEDHGIPLGDTEAYSLIKDYLSFPEGSGPHKVVQLVAGDVEKLGELWKLLQSSNNTSALRIEALHMLRQWGLEDLTLGDVLAFYAPLGDPDDPIRAC